MQALLPVVHTFSLAGNARRHISLTILRCRSFNSFFLHQCRQKATLLSLYGCCHLDRENEFSKKLNFHKFYNYKILKIPYRTLYHKNYSKHHFLQVLFCSHSWDQVFQKWLANRNLELVFHQWR